MKCELCAEFSRTRHPGEPGRIVTASEHFVVVPTRGPLHPLHLLICSREHATGLHDLSANAIGELAELLVSLRRRFRELGHANVLAFENGTPPGSEGGCSIVHFHLHLVPTLLTVTAEDVSESTSWKKESNLWAAAQTARGLGSYVLMSYNDSSFCLASREGLPSQHMRRLVADRNNIAVWDWREVHGPEQDFEHDPMIHELWHRAG